MLKLIKKLFIFILFITFVLSLTACDHGYHLYHEYIHKESNIISIELINYDNPVAQNNPLEESLFDLERLEILGTLSVDNIGGFLNKLSEIGGLTGRHKKVLNSPTGKGIRLIYQDGFFTLITVTVVEGKDCIFVGHYDADTKNAGKFGIYWQEMIDDFKTLVNEYFSTQI